MRRSIGTSLLLPFVFQVAEEERVRANFLGTQSYAAAKCKSIAPVPVSRPKASRKRCLVPNEGSHKVTYSFSNCSGGCHLPGRSLLLGAIAGQPLNSKRNGPSQPQDSLRENQAADLRP